MGQILEDAEHLGHQQLAWGGGEVKAYLVQELDNTQSKSQNHNIYKFKILRLIFKIKNFEIKLINNLHPSAKSAVPPEVCEGATTAPVAPCVIAAFDFKREVLPVSRAIKIG